MTFLFGDSTPSKLEINYLAFLKDALDLSVALLNAEERVRQGDLQREQRKLAADSELADLMNLGADLVERLARAEETASANAREAAQRIRAAADAAVQQSATAMRAQLAGDLQSLDARRLRERESMLKALEAFLLRNDFPDTAFQHLIRVGARGTRAELTGQAGCKVDWVMSLEVPRDSVFAAPFRVDRLADGLEIQVPEVGGMMKKAIKFRPYKLSAKWITELVISPKEGHIKLRGAIDDATDGCDITIGPTRKITMTRIGKDAAEPFEPGDEDCSKILQFYRDLSTAAAALNKSRSALLSAHLDGKSFAAHEDPTALCERLVMSMVPTVSEIIERSTSKNELVLKRVVGEDRREEIFCSKHDLVQKISQVPRESQSLFIPLGLVDDIPICLPRVAEPTAESAVPLPIDVVEAAAERPGRTSAVPEAWS